MPCIPSSLVSWCRVIEPETCQRSAYASFWPPPDSFLYDLEVLVWLPQEVFTAVFSMFVVYVAVAGRLEAFSRACGVVHGYLVKL